MMPVYYEFFFHENPLSRCRHCRRIFFLYSHEDQTVCDSDQLISNKKKPVLALFFLFLCVRFH